MVRVQTAQHIGRRHLIDGTNRQDALLAFETNGITVGLICDGCSVDKDRQPLQSEAGALLACAYLANTIQFYAAGGDSLHGIAHRLDKELQSYLELLLTPLYFDTPSDMNAYINRYLLFTVLGFMLKGEEAVVFNAGDGTLVVNDHIEHLNEGYQPVYPAYRKIPGLACPPLHVQTFAGYSRLAIGSDAWKDERDLLNAIWGFTHPRGLQRQINVWSDRQHRFADDVSLITVEVSE